LVDDEYAIVEILSAILEDEGYRMTTAANGQEGLERLAEELPDVALIDVMMPKLDGQAMLHAMRADPRFARVPVILMSAAEKFASEMTDGVAFLHKPFDVHALLAVIDRLLNGVLK
jgi:CheY-like chemotaxis protein